MSVPEDNNIEPALLGFVVEVVHGALDLLQVSVSKKNPVTLDFQGHLSHSIIPPVTVTNYEMTLNFQLVSQSLAVTVVVPGMQQELNPWEGLDFLLYPVAVSMSIPDYRNQHGKPSSSTLAVRKESLTDSPSIIALVGFLAETSPTIKSKGLAAALMPPAALYPGGLCDFSPRDRVRQRSG